MEHLDGDPFLSLSIGRLEVFSFEVCDHLYQLLLDVRLLSHYCQVLSLIGILM